MSELVEATSRSWFDRLKNSLKSVVGGLVLFLAALVLLCWTEGRAVRADNRRRRVEETVTAVAVNKVLSANERKLVLVAGKATTKDSTKDKHLKLRLKGIIKLERHVEMYQWQEDVEIPSRKKGEQKFTYHKLWLDKLIKSSDFGHASGHENPSKFKYKSETFYPATVKLGEFKLNKELLAQIKVYQPVVISQKEIKKMPKAVRKTATLSGEWLYLGNPGEPKVGDLRIRFRQVAPLAVSVLAKQKRKGFAPFKDEEYDRTYHVLKPGLKSKTEFIRELTDSARLLTWLLRLAGFIFMGAGIGLVFNPWVATANTMPFLGDILGFGIYVFALVGSAVFSLLATGFAWVFFQPLLGIGLLLGAIVLVVAGILVGRVRKPSIRSSVSM